MPGGKSPKRKGDNAERSFMKLMGGERTFFQPGNDGENMRGDIINIPYLGTAEVKVRADGFKQIYKWLSGCDILAVRADRKPWLVIIPATDLKRLTDEMDEVKKLVIAYNSRFVTEEV